MSKTRKRNNSDSAKKAGKANKLVKPAYGEVLYDVDGYRVGDDGYPLTKPRRRMHRLFDAVLIFAYICLVVAVVFVVWALFQGQSLTTEDFIAYGGNEYKGKNVASLMRGEALVAFIIGLIGIISSHRGFDWLYDGKEGSAVCWLLVGAGVLAAGWCVYLFANVQIVDPVSLIFMMLVVLSLATMRQVRIERPTLKPSVVSSSRKG